MQYLKQFLNLSCFQVNFERKSPEDFVEEGDFFTSLNHYHEDPVLDEPIDVIFENQDILVKVQRQYECHG